LREEGDGKRHGCREREEGDGVGAALAREPSLGGGTGEIRHDHHPERLCGENEHEVDAVGREEAVRLGRFLPDLYAHLGLIRLTIPPLRERREDVVALTEYFVSRYCERGGLGGVRVARSALAELTGYAWPGNARELQQTLEAALALTRTGELTAERVRTVLGRRPRRHLAPDVFPLRELERDYIATVLVRCNWNQSLAARRLGIGRNTLMRKIKSFKLEKSEAA